MAKACERAARTGQRIFLYGGRGLFDGMRAFALSNGYGRFIEQKDFEFKAKLMIRTNAPDGIRMIRKALAEAGSNGLDIRYIAAPEYLAKYTTKNAKKGQREFEEKLEKIGKQEKSLEVSFEKA